MFGQKKPVNPLSFIAQECHLTGKLIFSGDVLIAGHVSGDIQAQGNVTIETSGTVDGDILCRELMIAGQSSGEARCKKMTLHEQGTFEGDAYCEQIEILDGGQFLGYRHRDPLSTISANTDNKTATNP
ncbi:polymer-forming cytoskeletal protein [Shewanella sp.]|uniref:bactofilin family protein n=1 Tax=Shewanella sp. TaxID=50422 RepID=UPI00356B5461